jgi:outer membrane protein TolC
MVEVTRRAEDAAAANASLARELLEAGIAVPSDRMAADVRLAEVRAMRIRADHGRDIAHAALRRALGAADDARFVLDPPVDPPASAVDRVDARMAEALASRADLRALDRRLDQAGAGESVARHARLPSIGMGAQYEWNDDTPFGTAGGNWTVGLSVRVPLFDGTETGARIARARADRDRLVAIRRAMEDGVRLEVRSAWADRSAADERLAVVRSAVGQARESLRIVRERYSEGMAVMVELLAAEAALTQVEASEVEARRAVFLARAALDLATGRPLGADGTGTPEGVAR